MLDEHERTFAALFSSLFLNFYYIDNVLPHCCMNIFRHVHVTSFAVSLKVWPIAWIAPRPINVGLFLFYPSERTHHRLPQNDRKSTVPKYEPPYVKKPIAKKYTATSSNHSQEDSLSNADKILSFGSIPSFR